MSYCRWSSDNFRSDVYVYASGDDAYHTHIAGNRLLVPPIPQWRWYPDFGQTWNKETRKVVYPTRIRACVGHVYYSFVTLFNRLHHYSFRLIPHVRIDDELAGKSFTDETAGECADRLEMLRRRGYYVPERAIRALREEEQS